MYVSGGSWQNANFFTATQKTRRKVVDITWKNSLMNLVLWFLSFFFRQLLHEKLLTKMNEKRFNKWNYSVIELILQFFLLSSTNLLISIIRSVEYLRRHFAWRRRGKNWFINRSTWKSRFYQGRLSACVFESSLVAFFLSRDPHKRWLIILLLSLSFSLLTRFNFLFHVCNFVHVFFYLLLQ